MRACRRIGLVAAACFSLAATSALADDPARLQLSFLAPVQLVPESRDVSGVRLSLFFGKNARVSGFDLAGGGTYSGSFSGFQVSGFANFVEGNSTGVQLSTLGNSAKGEMTGLQAGFAINGTTKLSGAQIGAIFLNIAREGGAGLQLGGLNLAGGEFTGAQIAFLGNGSMVKYSATNLSVTGIQVAIFNVVDVDMTGLQIGAANLGGLQGTLAGVQIGVLNLANNCKGLQVGLFNGCKDMYGVQIGLLNFIREGIVKWLPIVNAKF